MVLKAYHRWGDRFVDHLLGHVRLRDRRARQRPGAAGPRPAGDQAAVPGRGRRPLRFASTLPALLAGGGVDTRIDPVALHHYLTFHSVVPPPRTILRGVAKLPPATLVAYRARRPSHRAPSTGHRTSPAIRNAAGWSEKDWEDAVLDALRLAVRRRLVADVPVGCLLSGGVDSSLIVGLLAEAGQTGLPTFSIGFESVGDVAGDEFVYSDIIAKRFGTDHHQIRIDTARMLPALDGAIGAMSEPMVSHDCVAFYLLSQEVAKHVKVVQSGQGADEVFAGYHWYPPLGGPGPPPRRRGGVLPVGVLRPGHRRRRRVALPRLPRTTATRADSSSPSTSPAPARRAAWTAALRLDTTVMLVDDPVKRVDNMTMAWGLEGRVPFLDHELVELAATCPPELKTAHGGKGVLKEAARRVIPAEVIDRPKGYFPVPALTHLQGPYLELVRDALYAPAAKERGLFAPRGRRPAAGRPERPADAVARQRTLAARAARTVAAEARHHRAGRMTERRCRRGEVEEERAVRASHTEAITLGPARRTRRSTWWTRWPTTSCSNSAGAG